MIPYSRSRVEVARAVACLLLFTGMIQAAAAPIILHLRNGDRISGELVRENGGRIVVKSPAAGTLSVSKAEVVRREVPGPPTPPLSPAPTAVVSPKPPLRPVTTAPSTTTNVAELRHAPLARPTSWLRPFLTNWHGNLGMGVNLGFGTTDREAFFANANAVHSWHRVVNSVSYNSAYGLVNKVEAANRMDGVLKTDIFVDQKRKLYTYNQFLGGYDSIRGIDQRFEEGVGLGYRLYERNRLVVNGEIGGQYQRFNYSRQPDHSLWSARFGENLTWKPNDQFSLTQRLQFLPNVTDLSEYRVRFELIASYPLFKRITLSMNLVDEYESRPPRTAAGNDLQVTTNVNIVF